MSVLVLILAYALGCCAMAASDERARKQLECLGLPWGFNHSPEILLGVGVVVAFVGGANL